MWFVDAALLIGIAVPFLYFGAQLAAIPFYPDYDIVKQSASELGSDRSNRPAVLNAGAATTGLAIILSSYGFLRRVPSPRFLAWLLFAALLSAGAAGLWAANFPLPDPRHNPRAIGFGAFLLPALFAVTMWKTRLRAYVIINFALFLALIPVMAGVTSLPIDDFRGALQRVAAAVLYVPIGVCAAWLRVSVYPSARSAGGSPVTPADGNPAAGG